MIGTGHCLGVRLGRSAISLLVLLFAAGNALWRRVLPHCCPAAVGKSHLSTTVLSMKNATGGQN